MNKLCETCLYHEDDQMCNNIITSCKIRDNQIRLTELNLAISYLNSDYYWNRRKELKGEDLIK